MAIIIRKYTRLAVYAFFLVLTAIVSALLGGKRNSEHSESVSLIPTTAHADIAPSPGDSPSPSPAPGSDCDSGSDSGDCCE